MPEMPEVTIMVRRLQKYVGMTIHGTSVDPSNDRYLPGSESSSVLGQKIGGIFRRGKMIIFMLERGAIVCHNAMSGYWDSAEEPWTFDYVEGERSPGESDIRATIIIAVTERMLESAQALRFHDSRKFGYLRYMTPEQLAEKLSKLGPDVVGGDHLYEPSAVATHDKFVEIFQKVRKPIKVALMEQQRVAGLGNIYAAESCFGAGISPKRIARDCSLAELSLLRSTAVNVLKSALERNLDYGGLSVYRKNVCGQCGQQVISEQLGGRTTYWCSKCQT
jgi:formamidopyrimidine-DNA glycosylase